MKIGSIAIALIAVAWVLSIVIRFALSRKREYLADASADLGRRVGAAVDPPVLAGRPLDGLVGALALGHPGAHVGQHERHALGGSKRLEDHQQREPYRVGQQSLLFGIDAYRVIWNAGNAGKFRVAPVLGIAT